MRRRRHRILSRGDGSGTWASDLWRKRRDRAAANTLATAQGCALISHLARSQGPLNQLCLLWTRHKAAACGTGGVRVAQCWRVRRRRCCPREVSSRCFLFAARSLGTAQSVSEFAQLGLSPHLGHGADRPGRSFAVGAYNHCGVWFTSATSFANPALPRARGQRNLPDPSLDVPGSSLPGGGAPPRPHVRVAVPPPPPPPPPPSLQKGGRRRVEARNPMTRTSSWRTGGIAG